MKADHLTEASEKAIVRTKLPDQIAEQLRARILSGSLPQGAQLRQETLATEFSVSRIPVREALRQLEAEGLVVSYPHRGAVVSEVSLLDIEEVFELRALVECELLRLAMPKLRDEDVAKADEIVKRSYGAGDGVEERDWGDLNWQFHAILYDPAGRPLTLEILRQLHRKAFRYLRLHMVITHGIDRARRDHSRLVELCAERNLREGVDFLRQHILDARRDLVSAIVGGRAEVI